MKLVHTPVLTDIAPDSTERVLVRTREQCDRDDQAGPHAVSLSDSRCRPRLRLDIHERVRRLLVFRLRDYDGLSMPRIGSS